jgi:hypothetical protein
MQLDASRNKVVKSGILQNVNHGQCFMLNLIVNWKKDKWWDKLLV